MHQRLSRAGRAPAAGPLMPKYYPMTSPASLPVPASERGAWLLACTIGALGVAVLVLVLTGVVGGTRVISPPPVRAAAPTPAAAPVSPTGAAGVRVRTHAAIVAHPSVKQQRLEASSALDATQMHISTA